MRYELIGQDRVLEQLFRVLSMPSMAPIVVLLCGEHETLVSACETNQLKGLIRRAKWSWKEPACTQM